MNQPPLRMTSSAGPTAFAVRLGNVAVAARRLGRGWASGAPAAARGVVALWPVWTGGAVLVVLFAAGLDAASVGWVDTLPASVNAFFAWLNDFGKSGWLLFPLGSLCLVLLFADWRCARRRLAAAWTEVGLFAGFAFLSIAGAGIVTNVLKQFIGRGRPAVFDRDGAFSLVPFQFDYAQSSFPSGHATTAGALAVVIAVLDPRLRVPAFLFCGLVASSRVFVGAHYPSDVVAGFMVGAAFAWFYALALAHAGIVFACGPGGTIRARTIAIRRVVSQPGGFSAAAGALWSAVIGIGSRPAAV